MWSFWRAAVLEARGLKILKFAWIPGDIRDHYGLLILKYPQLFWVRPWPTKESRSKGNSKHASSCNQQAWEENVAEPHYFESQSEHSSQQTWTVHLNLHSDMLRNKQKKTETSMNPPTYPKKARWLTKILQHWPSQPPSLPHGGVPATWRWGCRGTLPKALGGFGFWKSSPWKKNPVARFFNSTAWIMNMIVLRFWHASRLTCGEWLGALLYWTAFKKRYGWGETHRIRRAPQPHDRHGVLCKGSCRSCSKATWEALRVKMWRMRWKEEVWRRRKPSWQPLDLMFWLTSLANFWLSYLWMPLSSTNKAKQLTSDVVSDLVMGIF